MDRLAAIESALAAATQATDRDVSVMYLASARQQADKLATQLRALLTILDAREREYAKTATLAEKAALGTNGRMLTIGGGQIGVEE